MTQTEGEMLAACGLDCGPCPIRQIPLDASAAEGAIAWLDATVAVLAERVQSAAGGGEPAEAEPIPDAKTEPDAAKTPAAAPAPAAAVPLGGGEPVVAVLAGNIFKVNVKPGDSVAEGDPLFRLDSSRFQAALDEIDARLALARDRLDRREALADVPRIPYVFAYHEIIRSPATAKASPFAGDRCEIYYQGRLSPDFYAWVFPHGDTTSVGVGSAIKGFSLREATARTRETIWPSAVDSQCSQPSRSATAT